MLEIYRNMKYQVNISRFFAIVFVFIFLGGCGSLTRLSNEEIACISNSGSTISAPVKSGEGPENKPEYPALSKRRDEQGRVVVGVLVDSTGKVVDAEVEKSSGYPLLDNAAFRFAAKEKFSPGLCNGAPVTMAHEVPVTFFMN